MIDQETAERWVGIYVKDFGELPSETMEKCMKVRLTNPDIPLELLVIYRIRPKFLKRVGATKEQMEWLGRRVGWKLG